MVKTLLLLCFGLLVTVGLAYSQVPTYYNGLYFDTGGTTPGGCTAPAFFYVPGNTTTYVCGNDHTFHATSGSGTLPGGTGIVVVNNSLATAVTMNGDGTFNPVTGGITILKTGGNLFAPSATIDTTNAANISSGLIPLARLPLFTPSTLGAVPASSGGTTNFLRADGAWAAPPGGGGGGGSTGGAYTQTFTSQTTILLTHNLNTTSVLTSCFDSSHNEIGANTITNTDVNDTTVTFTNAQTGSCTSISGGSASSGNSTFASGTFASCTTCSIPHNLNTAYPSCSLYDSAGCLIGSTGTGPGIGGACIATTLTSFQNNGLNTAKFTLSLATSGNWSCVGSGTTGLSWTLSMTNTIWTTTLTNAQWTGTITN